MIPGLDGLRAIAILIVLGFHVNISHLGFGWMGVQLFFVLSGFLITGILLRMKESLPGKQYFYKFYGRRFLRIFPLYYSYLLILTIALKFMNAENQSAIAPQLPYAYFYIYDFFHASSAFQHTEFLTHLWSLSVEEQFYVLWPLILFFTPKDKIKTLFITTIALGPVFRVFTYFVYNNHLLPSLLDNPYLAIYILPFSHVDAFALGAFVSQYSLPKPRMQIAILAFALPAVGFITQYFTAGKITLNTLGYYDDGLSAAYKFIWAYSALNYFFALIIHAVDQTRLFTRVLENFILKYLGKISYGLYVYHFPMIWLISEIRRNYRFKIDPNLDFALTYLAALILTTAVASVSFHFFEKPINDLKEKLFPMQSS